MSETLPPPAPEDVPAPDAPAEPAERAAPAAAEPTESTASESAAAAADLASEPAAPSAAEPVSSLNPAEVAQRLKQLFPALFAGAVKPLKLRIQVDIQERAPGTFGKQALSAFFRRHTGSTSYLIAVGKAPSRFDLDGQPAGEITPEHRQVALDELARRRGNQESRRELEEQQRRNRAGLLHDFQITTLTKANFCVLKGVPVDELDGLLEIARGEAEARAQQSPPSHHAPHHAPSGGDRPPRRPENGPRDGARPPRRPR